MTNTPPATIHLGDCIEVMRTLPENSVDAVITDPPYGLGFMGKAWDELPPGEEWARECLRVLKPGGHLLAFGGSRTWHRLAVAVEDAGFEVRDSIAWLYGSGFPKSLDVSKAIDKRGGNPDLANEIGAAIKAARVARGWTTGQADRHFCGGSTNWTWYEGRKGECHPPIPANFTRIVEEWPELAPYAAKVAEADREVIGRITHSRSGGDDFAKRPGVVATPRTVDDTVPATPAAQQWQGWGTALKPAFEPIVVARKPIVGTVAANVLAHGTGALNIDGCRVGTEERVNPPSGAPGANNYRLQGGDGRDVDNARRYAEKSKALPPTVVSGRWPANVVLDESQAAALDEQSGYMRTGTATPGAGGFRTEYVNGERKSGGSFPQAALEQGGGASRFFYVAKAPTRERPKVDGVAHPTVKPLALMRWLVRLVTPPGGTVLEPFAGSGTTVEACALEGFACIAIEREPDYLQLIQARLARVAAAQPEPAGPSLFDIEATA